jgi:CDP-6-deoxy-D-xylo-4-hexulose-3-dehydrase
MIPFVDLHRQYKSIQTEIDQVIQDVIKDTAFIVGKRLTEFVSEFANWLGVKHSVFVNSGASANLLSMSILKLLNPGYGEIIVPTLTWSSDIYSIIQAGFRPVFVDVDMNTLGMNTDAIIEAITSDTMAVFLSHIQGFNALSDKLLDELTKRGIILI